MAVVLYVRHTNLPDGQDWAQKEAGLLAHLPVCDTSDLPRQSSSNSNVLNTCTLAG
jgi:hypothetical protein